MAYCSKCGSKVNKDDLYCGVCGEKQVQNSDSVEEKEDEISGFQNASFKARDFHEAGKENMSVNKLSSSILIKMLYKPITTAKEFVIKGSKDKVIGISLFVVLMQGILGMWKAKQFISNIHEIAVNFIMMLMKLVGLIEPNSLTEPLDINDAMEIKKKIYELKTFINIPYTDIFMQNIAIVLIAVAVNFIIIYLGMSIAAKGRNESFKIYKTAIIVLVPLEYFEIISILFSNVSFWLGLIFGIIGVIISIITMVIVVRDVLTLEENRSAFLCVVSWILILMMFMFTFKKLLMSNMINIQQFFNTLMD
ncbi:hypothetical protein ACER0A_002950 [Haloimpatiens sp. FM7315]|uniref:hypothetical protein n=1 Tax=Haloimpatiens sp. FM7315 TaxID=3298609 RepID=UPI0035A2CC7C